MLMHINEMMVPNRFDPETCAVPVAFWVNKPLLDTCNEEQTKNVRMYT